ncbi:MAG TPA: S1 family peptidase [Mycobacteriales bacterium]|nr:S1 family peptidase [Mycobacteriales bacterium]
MNRRIARTLAVLALPPALLLSAATASAATGPAAAQPKKDPSAGKAKLDLSAGKARHTVAAWYVDQSTGTVVVEATDVDDARSFVRASGAGADPVRIVKVDELPRPFYDVRGGDAFYIGSPRCSVGFSVRRGTSPGFVTAGHCGRRGAATAGYNRVTQGTFAGSSFPGNDHAWVQTNSSWQPTPRVNRYNGAYVTVTGSTPAPIGAAVCRSGSTTGWRCGTVQAVNATVNYPQGTVSGLTRTNACAEPGDSGGSFLSGSQAQGVVSGGSGNCSSGGTTYFQPLGEILSTYGLTLVVG